MSERNRLLLVDDNRSLVNVFKTILENEGYLMETAFTGIQALMATKRADFDLIIMDILLPDVRGDLVVKEIKKKDNNIRVMLITGNLIYASVLI